jgi:hypothetical protein
MLDFIEKKVDQSCYTLFPNLSGVLGEHQPCPDLRRNIQFHLATLRRNYDKYFPDNNTEGDRWILNPFQYTLQDISDNLSVPEQLEYIRLAADLTEKAQFDPKSLVSSWPGLKLRFPKLSEKSLKRLTEFSNTYLCESSFSKLVYAKNDYRKRINVESDFRIILTDRKPSQLM